VPMNAADCPHRLSKQFGVFNLFDDFDCRGIRRGLLELKVAPLNSLIFFIDVETGGEWFKY
jgi:hypothetical protein